MEWNQVAPSQPTKPRVFQHPPTLNRIHSGGPPSFVQPKRLGKQMYAGAFQKYIPGLPMIPEPLEMKPIDMKKLPDIYSFDFENPSLERKWNSPREDITDYFNYGFNEETWKVYAEKVKNLHEHVQPCPNPDHEKRVLGYTQPMDIGGFGEPYFPEAKETPFMKVVHKNKESRMYTLSKNPYHSLEILLERALLDPRVIPVEQSLRKVYDEIQPGLLALKRKLPMEYLTFLAQSQSITAGAECAYSSKYNPFKSKSYQPLKALPPPPTTASSSSTNPITSQPSLIQPSDPTPIPQLTKSSSTPNPEPRPSPKPHNPKPSQQPPKLAAMNPLALFITMQQHLLAQSNSQPQTSAPNTENDKKSPEKSESPLRRRRHSSTSSSSSSQSSTSSSGSSSRDSPSEESREKVDRKKSVDRKVAREKAKKRDERIDRGKESRSERKEDRKEKRESRGEKGGRKQARVEEKRRERPKVKREERSNEKRGKLKDKSKVTKEKKRRESLEKGLERKTRDKVHENRERSKRKDTADKREKLNQAYRNSNDRRKTKIEENELSVKKKDESSTRHHKKSAERHDTKHKDRGEHKSSKNYDNRKEIRVDRDATLGKRSSFKEEDQNSTHVSSRLKMKRNRSDSNSQSSPDNKTLREKMKTEIQSSSIKSSSNQPTVTKRKDRSDTNRKERSNPKASNSSKGESSIHERINTKPSTSHNSSFKPPSQQKHKHRH